MLQSGVGWEVIKKENSEIATKKQKLTHRNIVIFVDMYFEVKKETMRTN